MTPTTDKSIELKETTENYPLIEPLQPNSTQQLLIDIDHTIIGPVAQETPSRVKTKIQILNKAILFHAISTGNQTLATLLTLKPSLVFSHPDTAEIYKPMQNIQSVRRGQINGQPVWVAITLPHAATELGVITRIKNEINPNEPILITSPGFEHLKSSVKELEQILTDNYIFKNGKQEFRLEPGNHIYVAVQSVNGTPLPKNDKLRVVGEIKQLLNRLNRKDLIELLDFSVEGNDVDITWPNVKTGKTIGVEADIQSKHYQGYPWYNEKNIVICDDKWSSAGLAAQRVLDKGGHAITFANGDQKLKELLKRHQKGFVSKHQEFLGLVDGIHWLSSGKPMTDSQIENICQRLELAK